MVQATVKLFEARVTLKTSHTCNLGRMFRRHQIPCQQKGVVPLWHIHEGHCLTGASFFRQSIDLIACHCGASSKTSKFCWCICCLHERCHTFALTKSSSWCAAELPPPVPAPLLPPPPAAAPPQLLPAAIPLAAAPAVLPVPAVPSLILSPSPTNLGLPQAWSPHPGQ